MEERPAPPRDGEHKPSFWSTMPGILSGLAALLTAMAGLLAAASASGLLTAAPPAPGGQALVSGETVPPSPTSSFVASASPSTVPLVESASLPTSAPEGTVPLIEAGASPSATPSSTPSAVEPTPLSTPTSPGATSPLLTASTAVETLEVEVVTGEFPDAGTVDEITLSLPRNSWKLSELSPLPQQPGETRRYTLSVERALTVGDIRSIEICKARGNRDHWYLAQVTLYVNEQSFQVWEVSQWLDNGVALCWQEG